MNYSLDEAPDAGTARLLRRSWRWMRAHARPLTRAVWAVSLLTVLAIMGYQIAQNWREIRSYPWQLHPGYILLGFCVYSVSVLVSALVWASIMRRLTSVQARLEHVRLYCLTNLANRLPTPLPFIGARTEAYAALGVPRSATLTAMVLETTTLILGGVLAAFLTLPFGIYRVISNQINLALFALVLVPLAVLVLRPGLLMWLLNTALVRLKRAPLPQVVRARDTLGWSGLCVLIWVNSGLLYYCLANSIYVLEPAHILVMINIFAISGVIGRLAQFLFFIPNLALRQLVTASLLSLVIPWPVAIALVILVRLCVMVFELIWASVLNLVPAARRLPH